MGLGIGAGTVGFFAAVWIAPVLTIARPALPGRVEKVGGICVAPFFNANSCEQRPWEVVTNDARARPTDRRGAQAGSGRVSRDAGASTDGGAGAPLMGPRRRCLRSAVGHAGRRQLPVQNARR